jgi:hypothetical protein
MSLLFAMAHPSGPTALIWMHDPMSIQTTLRDAWYPVHLLQGDRDFALFD